MRAALEYKLRRRFRLYGVGIWVGADYWDSVYVTVSIRSTIWGEFTLIPVLCVDSYGEVDMKKTYREAKGKIKKWVRSF